MSKNKNIFIALLVVLFGSLVSFSQQSAQYTLNSYNKYVVNPGIAGTEDFIDIRASYRNQWQGLKGAPKTTYLSFHMPVGRALGTSHDHRLNEKHSWFGIGAFVANDATGPTSRQNSYGTVSYNIQLNKTFRASLGLSLGFINYRFDGGGVALIDQEDVIFNSSTSVFTPDANAGLWVYSEYFYIGLSSNQLFNSSLNFSVNDENTNGSNLNRHYFASTGVNIPVNQQISLVPSVLVKLISPAPVSVDLGLKIDFNNDYWFGIYSRAGDSFSLVAGTLLLKKYSISYGYDINYSALNAFNGGSHEILIGFRWPPKPQVDCPSRFW